MAFVRKSLRLRDYDYRQTGWYFVTVCTQHHEMTFGHVKDHVVVLNDIGAMVDRWWRAMFEKYHSIRLDEYVIMPNHMHGVIMIVEIMECRSDLVT